MTLDLHCLNIFTLVWLLGYSEITVGQERHIKPEDAIDIMVLGNEELSKTVIVGSDGMVNYPLLAEISLEGITVQRLQQIIVAQIERIIEPNPFVVVRFAKNYLINVTVLGQVRRPGIYEVPNTIALQVALALAEITSPGAQLTHIKLIRKNDDETKVQLVNLEKFYFEGDQTYLPYLKDGDIISVPPFPFAKKVKVLGAVVNPGSYELHGRATLLDVILLAGGPTERAKMNDIKVTQGSAIFEILFSSGDKLKERHFDLDRLLKKKSENIPLIEPGAVIFVPEQNITWRTIMTLVRDATVFATLIIVLQRDSR